MAAFDAGPDKLGPKYVDLYRSTGRPSCDLSRDTWLSLERTQVDGRARAVGVSNFAATQLRALIDDSPVGPG